MFDGTTENVSDQVIGNESTTDSTQDNDVELQAQPVLFIVGTVGILINMFSCAIWFKVKKKPKSSYDVFLLTHLVADFLCSLNVFIFAFGNIVKFKTCIQQFVKLCGLILKYITVFNTTLLTSERYLRIVFPVWHRNNMTKSKAFLMLLSIIVLACMIGFINNSLLPFSSKMCFGTYSLSRLHENIIGSCTTVATNIIPFVIFVYCYMHMLITVKKRQKITPSQSAQRVPQRITQLRNSASNTHVTCQGQATSVDQIYVKSDCDIDVVNQKDLKLNKLHGSNNQYLNASGTSLHNIETSIRCSTGTPQPSTSGTRINNSSHRMSKVEKNLLLVALFINLSFLGCNMPARTYYWMAQLGWFKITPGTVWDILVGLMYLHPSLDPLIYIFTLRDIRRNICSLCKRGIA